MTHMVEHRPLFEELPERYRTLSPDWRVQSDGAPGLAPFSVRCYHESTATRVAQALDLLDAADRSGGFRSLPIDEKEIMQRAREAAIAGSGVPGCTTVDIRNGRADGSSAVLAAACALRDLSKPLADLVPPPVDPDLIEARKIVTGTVASDLPVKDVERGVHDQSAEVQAALAALKRGREIERKDCGLGPRQEFTASQL